MRRTKRTPEQIRRSAYQTAKQYMRDMGLPSMVKNMTEQNLNLFLYVRRVNERIQSERNPR